LATSAGISYPAANVVQISTNSTSAVYVDASQNVGIGTSSPTNKLTVSGSANVTGTITANAVLAGFVSGTSNIYLRNLSGFNRIDSYNDPITATYPLAINSSLTRFNIADVEAMRIDSSGNLLVGTTTLSDGSKLVIRPATNQSGLTVQQNGAGDYCMHLNAISNGGAYYFEYFLAGATNVGSISSNGTTTAYNTTSDYRLKENVTPMTTGLEKISALKPVNYDWISDKSQGEGFIAHELAEVIPLAVTGGKDAVDADGKPTYQGVDYSKVVVHLVAAIRELSAKVDAQAAEITALQAKVGA